jgi:hypothetical protein
MSVAPRIYATKTNDWRRKMKTKLELRETFEAIIDALETAKKDADPALQKAVEKWARDVSALARQYLARPSWLLTPSIIDKVVDYDKRGKIWGMAGFKAGGDGKRAPGKYGRYHEAGYAADRKQVKVPDHFLRRAKLAKGDQLKKDVDAALVEVLRVFNDVAKRGVK